MNGWQSVHGLVQILELDDRPCPRAIGVEMDSDFLGPDATTPMDVVGQILLGDRRAQIAHQESLGWSVDVSKSGWLLPLLAPSRQPRIPGTSHGHADGFVIVAGIFGIVFIRTKLEMD